MTGRNKRWLALWIVALVIAGGLFGTASNSSPAAERPSFGPVVISPTKGSWHDYQRPIIRASEFDLAKVHLPPGFATNPGHVVDLIDDGARTIMLKTEDCRSDGTTTFRHLVDRGFLDVIQEWPEIDFVVQVGNEPERCPGTMASYFNNLHEVITEVKPEVNQPNLHWVAGLPMTPQLAIELMESDWLLDLYDGVGTNMLGHYSLLNEYHGWHEIVDYVLDETDSTLWLTEIGINHPPMDKAEKARRILAYVDQLPADRVGGVAVFTLGEGTDWPQYEITEAMVPIFADREDCYYFAPTGHFLCGQFKQYWESYGGLPIFGYPITAEEPGGNGETVQFLERSRFEWHPDVWPEKYDVLLGHLGWEMVDRRRGEAAFESVDASPQPGDDCVYFAPTGQHLCDQFLTYWNTFGGLPIFGYPISQELTENGFTVQYFERARFEHQPGVWAARFDVLQGLLGVQAVDGTLGNPPAVNPLPDETIDDDSGDLTD